MQERENFYKQYQLYLQKKNLNNAKIPLFQNKPIDIYLVHKTVNELGGFHKVNQQGLWKNVALLVLNDESLGFSLRSYYSVHVYPFEQVVMKLQFINSSMEEASFDESVDDEDDSDVPSSPISQPAPSKPSSAQVDLTSSNHTSSTVANIGYAAPRSETFDEMLLFAAASDDQHTQKRPNTIPSEYYRYRKRPKYYHKEEIELLRKVEGCLESGDPSLKTWALHKICWWSSLSYPTSTDPVMSIVRIQPLYISKVQSLIPFLVQYIVEYLEYMDKTKSNDLDSMNAKQIKQAIELEYNTFTALVAIHNLTACVSNAKLIANYEHQLIQKLLVDMLHKGLLCTSSLLLDEWKLKILEILHRTTRHIYEEAEEKTHFPTWSSTLMVVFLSLFSQHDQVMMRKPNIFQKHMIMDLHVLSFKVTYAMFMMKRGESALASTQYANLLEQFFTFADHAILKHMVKQITVHHEGETKQCRNLAVAIFYKLASIEATTAQFKTLLVESVFNFLLESLFKRLRHKALDERVFEPQDDFADDEDIQDYISDDEDEPAPQQQEKSMQQRSYLELCAVTCATLAPFVSDSKKTMVHYQNHYEPKIVTLLCTMKNPYMPFHFELSKYLASVLYTMNKVAV